MTETAGSTPPKPRLGARLLEWWGRLDRPIKALAGLAGAVAAILSLWFLLDPDAAPKGTPDEATASLERVRVEAVTRKQALDREGLPTTGYTDEQLAARGGFVSFDLAVNGYGGDSLPVRWYVLNQAGDTVGSEDKRRLLTPDRDTQSLSDRFWVPVPPEGGPFRVVIEVYPPGTKIGDTARRPLDDETTDPFTS